MARGKDFQILDKEAIRELEDFIKMEIERIVFNEERSMPKITGYKTVNKVKIPQRNGSKKIEDDSGDLRRSIKKNRGFIKQDKRGFYIDLKVMEYFKYLDGEDDNGRKVRQEKYSWFLREAIFGDKKIRDKIREVTAASGRRSILKIFSDMKKDLEK